MILPNRGWIMTTVIKERNGNQWSSMHLLSCINLVSYCTRNASAPQSLNFMLVEKFTSFDNANYLKSYRPSYKFWGVFHNPR